MRMYILENKIPVPVDDVSVWSKWFGKETNRIIFRDTIDGVLVSTVFLGIDHNFGNYIDDGEEWKKDETSKSPILFETMIFGANFEAEELVQKFFCPNQFQKRCRSWEESETIHRNAVEMVKKYLEDKKMFETSLR